VKLLIIKLKNINYAAESKLKNINYAAGLKIFFLIHSHERYLI